MVRREEAQSNLCDEMKIPFYTCKKMRNFDKMHQILRQVAKFRFLENFQFCENPARITVSRNRRNIFRYRDFFLANINNFREIKRLA